MWPGSGTTHLALGRPVGWTEPGSFVTWTGIGVKILAAAKPARPSTAPLAASAGVVQDCRQWVAVFRLTKRRLMLGTLLTVCDPYALPGFYCSYDACLPISS